MSPTSFGRNRSMPRDLRLSASPEASEHTVLMPTPTGSRSIPVPAAPFAGRRSLHLAWASVAVIPVAFIAAFVLREWLRPPQGYGTGTGSTAPIEVVLLAGISAGLVMVAPGIAAAWLGFRARRLGIANGAVPAVIGIAAAAFGALTNTLPLLLNAG